MTHTVRNLLGYFPADGFRRDEVASSISGPSATCVLRWRPLSRVASNTAAGAGRDRPGNTQPAIAYSSCCPAVPINSPSGLNTCMLSTFLGAWRVRVFFTRLSIASTCSSSSNSSPTLSNQ